MVAKCCKIQLGYSNGCVPHEWPTLKLGAMGIQTTVKNRVAATNGHSTSLLSFPKFTPAHPATWQVLMSQLLKRSARLWKLLLKLSLTGFGAQILGVKVNYVL